MSFWGNLDFANNRPMMPNSREVVSVATGTTANLTLGGSRVLVFTANVSSAVQPGVHVYGDNDPNSVISKIAKDASNFDVSDVAFWRANNTVASVSGNTVVLNNIITANFGAGKLVYFALKVLYMVTVVLLLIPSLEV